MRRFEYGQVESRELHPRVLAALAVECGGKADVIGLLGEIVARRTFVPEGFADPRDYCVRALRMSADQAVRRLRAARTAHQFPSLLPAIADGRLGVTAINTLGPHLTADNCSELVALAAEKRDLQIKAALETDMRLVRMEDGRLEVALERSAARSMINDLARKLEQWTGRRWAVIVSNEPGQPTLRAQAQAAKAKLTDGVHADPRVQAVMARFPGTQVIDVRRLAPEPAADLSDDAALDAAGDDDDL